MQRRQGFTITELLVSMALILFVMAMLSQAFVAGLGVFRDLKAVGDMDQKLRSAMSILVRDLSSDHFNNPSSKLSALKEPPVQGFFVVSQGNASTYEGIDDIPSYRSPDHILHFSVNLGGYFIKENLNLNGNAITESSVKLKRRENYLSASVPPNSPSTPLAGMSPFFDNANYLSQFGEVAYFLQPNTLSTPGTLTQPSLPLYTLYRKQLVVLTNDHAATMNAVPISGTTWHPDYYDVSYLSDGTKLRFNTMTDLANPGKRALSTTPAYTTFFQNLRNEPAQLAGADIILSDVISFSVLVMRTGDSDFIPPPITPQPTYRFDTATNPFSASTLRAVKISIRVWDPKTLKARQMTIVQDL